MGAFRGLSEWIRVLALAGYRRILAGLGRGAGRTPRSWERSAACLGGGTAMVLHSTPVPPLDESPLAEVIRESHDRLRSGRLFQSLVPLVASGVTIVARVHERSSAGEREHVVLVHPCEPPR